jgi:CHAT domain-containing protein
MYAEAEAYHLRALAIYEKTLGPEHPHVAMSLNNLALLYRATHRKAEAMALMQRAAGIDTAMLRQCLSIGSESQRMLYLQTLQRNFYSFLSLVLQDFSRSPLAIQAAFDIVLQRKAIGAEVLAAQRDAVLGGRYPHLQPQLRALIALRMQIAQKTLAGPGPEGVQTHQQLLAQWHAQREQLEVELVHQIPEMNLAQQLQVVNQQAVAQALPAEGVLVEFVRFDVLNFQAVPARGELRWQAARYLAFLLPAGDQDNVQIIDLGDAEHIDQKIAAFRRRITGGDRHLLPSPIQPLPLAWANAGADLRAAVFDPCVPHLAGRQQLFLAPDGDLALVPFEVLPLDGGHCLIEDYHISYVNTGRDVLRFQMQATGQPMTPPLIAADPDFNLSIDDVSVSQEIIAGQGRQSRALDHRALHFTQLYGARQEGEQIARILGVQPMLAGAVLEQRLKTQRSPYILHIATHGFFFTDQQQHPPEDLLQFRPIGIMTANRLTHISTLENPLLRSGLVLAGANTWLQGGTLPPEAEDGLLTAEDVTGLDLLATQLVVLSACDTGLGDTQVGEGVFGLRRAFVLAGAKTLVMSLWKVPDQQTQALMSDFYQRLLAGQRRAEALRDAQLKLKQQHSHPFYWGAFICQGEPGPLPPVSM